MTQPSPRTRISRTDAQQTAPQAFLVKKAEIDRALDRLIALSANHFNCNPTLVDWGDVGDAARYAELLKRITDSAFKEGEFAE